MTSLWCWLGRHGWRYTRRWYGPSLVELRACSRCPRREYLDGDEWREWPFKDWEE